MSEDKTKKRPSSRPSPRAKSGRSAKKGSSPTPAAKRGVPARRKPSAAAGATSRKLAGGKRPDKSPAPTGGRLEGAREFVSRHRAPVAACCVLLVVIVSLYGPSRDLYCAWRDNGRLVEEESEASAEKEVLESDIEHLTSKDGVKDQAREMGYVEEGETSIVVKGDDEPEETGDDEAEEAPWYLRALDVLFAYEEGQ